jgi:hypothetical protein
VTACETMEAVTPPQQPLMPETNGASMWCRGGAHIRLCSMRMQKGLLQHEPMCSATIAQSKRASTKELNSRKS